MDFNALSAARYSLRKFSAQPVEPEKLALILEAGRNAPTAHNFQPQRIFVQSAGESRQLHGQPLSPAGDPGGGLRRCRILETGDGW